MSRRSTKQRRAARRRNTPTCRCGHPMHAHAFWEARHLVTVGDYCLCDCTSGIAVGYGGGVTVTATENLPLPIA